MQIILTQHLSPPERLLAFGALFAVVIKSCSTRGFPLLHILSIPLSWGGASKACELHLLCQSWEEVSQEVLLVDLAHLIPRHLVHQLQACRDRIGRHVLPARNADVSKLMTVYCREED